MVECASLSSDCKSQLFFLTTLLFLAKYFFLRYTKVNVCRSSFWISHQWSWRQKCFTLWGDLSLSKPDSVQSTVKYVRPLDVGFRKWTCPWFHWMRSYYSVFLLIDLAEVPIAKISANGLDLGSRISSNPGTSGCFQRHMWLDNFELWPQGSRGFSLRVRGLLSSHDEWSSGCLSLVNASLSESSGVITRLLPHWLPQAGLGEGNLCMGRKSDRLHNPSWEGNITPDARSSLLHRTSWCSELALDKCRLLNSIYFVRLSKTVLPFPCHKWE